MRILVNKVAEGKKKRSNTVNLNELEQKAPSLALARGKLCPKSVEIGRF